MRRFELRGEAMRRRAFFAFIGGATAWPLAVRAQQTARIRRIGVLMQYAEGDPEGQIRAKVLMQELEKLGWKSGLLMSAFTVAIGGKADMRPR